MWVLSKEKFSRDIFSNNGIYITGMLNVTFKLGSPTKWNVHLLKTVTIMSHIIYVFQESETCNHHGTRFICPRQNEPRDFIYCCNGNGTNLVSSIFELLNRSRPQLERLRKSGFRRSYKKCRYYQYSL